MSACAVCGRLVDDGLHACTRHTTEVRAWLAELPQQVLLLQRELLAPAGAPTQGRLGGTGRAHAPVPVDLRVLTLLGPGHADLLGTDDDGTVPVLALLGGWAGHLAYTYPAVNRDQHGTAHTRPCEAALPRHGHTVTGWCQWLTAYLPYACTLPAFADLHHQLGALLARIRDLTHAVPHRHPQGAPCPSCDAFALVAVDGQWGITCEACGHHLEPDAYTRHAEEVLHAHQAARATAEVGP